MKWQQVAIILASILVAGGVITYVDLFGSLFQLTGVSATHSGDTYCTGTCESYINVTTTYWRICFSHYKDTKYENEILFKKVSRSRTLHVNLDKVENIITTEPKVKVDWMVPARGKGNWRPIKDGDCWDRLKTNKIKLVGYKEDWQDVKWSFETGYVEIDPIWESGTLVGNKIVKELCNPINKTWTDEIPYQKNCTRKEVYYPQNDSTIKAYNYTCIDYKRIEHINEQVDCGKKGKVDVDGTIIQDERRWCELIKEEVCCLSNIDGGRYGNWDSPDVDKVCTKVEDI